jgi:hypothetical protein
MGVQAVRDVIREYPEYASGSRSILELKRPARHVPMSHGSVEWPPVLPAEPHALALPGGRGLFTLPRLDDVAMKHFAPTTRAFTLMPILMDDGSSSSDEK